MKRVPLRRLTPLRQRSPLKRKSRLRPVNPKRLKRLRAEQYGGWYAGWICSWPCVACGNPPPTVPAHAAKTKGAGGKAHHLVPLCATCEDEFHRLGRWTFEAAHRVDLRAEAERLSGLVR